MTPAPDRAAIAATRRRLTRSSRAARAHLIVTVAIGAVDVALIVAQATLLARVITDAFIDGASLADVTPDLLWLGALALARGLVSAGFEIAGRLGAARVMAELRAQLVQHLLFVRPGALGGERRGELAAAAVQGVDALEAYFARYLPQVALAALAPPAILHLVLPARLGGRRDPRGHVPADPALHDPDRQGGGAQHPGALAHALAALGALPRRRPRPGHAPRPQPRRRAGRDDRRGRRRVPRARRWRRCGSGSSPR